MKLFSKVVPSQDGWVVFEFWGYMCVCLRCL